MEVDIKNLGHLPDTSSRILQTRLWTRSRNLATAIGVGHAKSGWNSQRFIQQGDDELIHLSIYYPERQKAEVPFKMQCVSIKFSITA